MPRVTKTKLVKVRMTPEEHQRLAALARNEGSISAFIRKQAFGSQNDAVLYLARIHCGILEIARTVGQHDTALSVTELLAHFVAIERHLNDLVSQRKL